MLGLGHTALLHQLLDAVHHFLQVVLGHGDGVFAVELAIFAGLLVLALGLAGHLAQIILGGIAQFLHQARNLLIRGAVFHGLLQLVLGLPHAFQRAVQITLFDLQRQIPQRGGQFVLLIGAQANV